MRQFSTVSKLSALLAKFQVERNIDVKGVSNKDIKRRLKQEFGDSLMFYYKSKRESEFIYHKSVDIEEDERSWFFLTVEEKVLKPLIPGGNKKVTHTSVQLQVCLSMCDLFVKVADIIRSDIEQMYAPFSSWPLLLEAVDYHHVKLPKPLKLLMNSLLSKNFPVAERVERLSSSLGQDIIYNMCNGKTKIIKYVQLGMTVRGKQDLDSCWTPSIALATRFLMMK